jgi:hypothetical protein
LKAQENKKGKVMMKGKGFWWIQHVVLVLPTCLAVVQDGYGTAEHAETFTHHHTPPATAVESDTTALPQASEVGRRSSIPSGRETQSSMQPRHWEVTYEKYKDPSYRPKFYLK